MKKYLAALGIAVASITLNATAEPARQTLVSGSDKQNFGIRCNQGDRVTLLIGDAAKDSDDRAARNIVITEISSGRYMFSYLRGLSNPSIPSSYIPAADEYCRTTAL